MFGAILTFAFLYALIWLFERKHRQIDAFLVAVAVIVPIIASFLVGLGAAALGFGIIGSWISLAVLIVVTFLSLWKIMGLPAKRSGAYSAAVVVFSIGLQLAFFSLSS